MSYLVYPTVRGVTAWPVTRDKNWESQVQQMSSGATVKLSYWANPLRSWEIHYGGGTNDSGYPQGTSPATSHLEPVRRTSSTIEGFYDQQQGRFGTFLYDDVTPGVTAGTGPYDSVTNQQIGTGDGTTTTFQLIAQIRRIQLRDSDAVHGRRNLAASRREGQRHTLQLRKRLLDQLGGPSRIREPAAIEPGDGDYVDGELLLAGQIR